MLSLIVKASGFAAVILVCTVVSSATAQDAVTAKETPAVTPEEGVAQLFVDDALLARAEGVVRKAHACQKLAKPVVEPEKPWEAARVYCYGSVIRDAESGLFRMWYMSLGPAVGGGERDPRLNHRPRDLVLYATSQDGIEWMRPDLGLYSFAGSKHNNIVFDFHSPSVVFDETATDPERRYIMFGCAAVNGERGYPFAHSADGIHWETFGRKPLLKSGDTCSLTRDPRTGEFLAFYKRTHEHRGYPRRLVYLSTSPDLDNWSEPVLVMAPDEIDDAQTQAEGGRFSQFYNMAAFPYGGQFLGFVTHFRYCGPPKEKGPEQSGHDGPIDVQLVHSRDGRQWHRCEDRSPVVPNGPYAYDAGCILGVANQPIVVDDEIWLYYTAITTTHGGYIPKKRITVARAVWPLDRFVSMNAEGAGLVETRAFPCPGHSLFVNADASGGKLAVAVLDGKGDVLPGYGVEQCVRVTGDSLRHEIRWQDAKDLPEGQSIRLEFHLTDAQLFSYTIK